jgi:outer membrane protein TolC
MRSVWRASGVLWAALVLAVRVHAAEPVPDAQPPTYPIDLPTALRLAGAQNLDVQIARQALREAEANRERAVEQFFPWLAVGAVYHRRDGFAQAVPAGTVSDTHYQSYAPGGTVAAQVVLGDAIYDALAAKQLVRASEQQLEAQRHDSVLAAAQGYFELAKAKALVEVAKQALDTSQSYQRQLEQAVLLGIAFKGDELRVRTQTGVYEIALRRVCEQERIAAAALAQTLHLDPAIELVPQDPGLAPLTLFPADASVDTLVRTALRSRPELQQSDSLVSAARQTEDAAVYGPLIPSVGAQAFVGALGGGHDGEVTHLGGSQDYSIGLSWRIGQGGLFDMARVHEAQAKETNAELNAAKLKDAVTAQVVEGLARVRSLFQQLTFAQSTLAAAADTLRLTRERKQYGVGVVLEDIQAQQALAQSRADYFSIIAESNKAQYGLKRAVGDSPDADERVAERADAGGASAADAGR